MKRENRNYSDYKLLVLFLDRYHAFMTIDLVFIIIVIIVIIEIDIIIEICR